MKIHDIVVAVVALFKRQALPDKVSEHWLRVNIYNEGKQ